jgi:hypothetical protein
MHRGRERVGSRVETWLNNNGTSDDLTWTRPTDWLALPAVNVGDKKFVGLYAVYNADSNFIAVNCAGAYNIDWGDGSATENIATGVQANHIYTSTTYAALAAGTYCSRGYKQVIVTIIPQGAGTLTAINLGVRHSSANQIYSTQWLDIKFASAALTSFVTYSANVQAGMMEQCNVVQWSPTYSAFSSMFKGCYALQSVNKFDTSSGVDFTSMFTNCYSLQSVLLFDLSSGVTFTSMFYCCYSLQSVPLFDLSSGVTFTSMFYGCSALQSVPLFDLSSGVTFTSMFTYCYALQSVPLFDLSSGVTFTSMFTNCYALQSVPLFDLSSGVTFTSMFSSCFSLQSVPLFDLSSGVTFTSMFNGCVNLLYIPLLVTSGCGITTTMFLTCRSLAKATLDGTKVAISYLNCKLATDELVDIFNYLYDFREVLTINVSPTTDWVADDVITGQSSGFLCVCVSKITATTYYVKGRTGVYTDGEQIGVTGNADKLADQNAGAPTTAIIEIMGLDVWPTTTWAVDDIIYGTTSFKNAIIVEKFSVGCYAVKSRSGAFTLDETLTKQETMTLDVAPGTQWANGATITGNLSGKTCVIVSRTSALVYEIKQRTGAFTLGEILSDGTYPADQGATKPTFAVTAVFSANQGAANPIFNGRGSTTITITGNWGAAGLSAANNLIATNKGWTIAT